jgi:hypothetical protein
MTVRGEQHDFKLVEEIISKTAKLAARHDHLLSLVPRQLTPDAEHETLLVLAEIDRNMKAILALMEEMEGQCERQLLFEREPTTAVST